MTVTFGDTWDVRFMRLAAEIASWSKDKSAKTGCVIVGPQADS